MNAAIRVIPCLDLNGGRVVKGVKFDNLRDAGDPVELARRYFEAGADEIVFLDVSASVEGRDTTLDTLTAVAAEVTIPITVGGGVRVLADADRIISAGASKVSINTAALARPELLSEISGAHGPGALVLSIDARRAAEGTTETGYEVTTHGGRNGTGLDIVTWARTAVAAGVGDILLNSIDADGVTSGYDLPMLRALRAGTGAPIIASGGAGAVEHFPAAVEAGATAVLAASVFHFAAVSIAEVKAALASAGYPVNA